MKTKKIACPECNGRGFLNHHRETVFFDGAETCHAWAETCQKCSGRGIVEIPMTNHDVIRSTIESEDKLAELLVSLMKGELDPDALPSLWCDPAAAGCITEDDGVDCNDENQMVCIKRWLRQEADDHV